MPWLKNKLKGFSSKRGGRIPVQEGKVSVTSSCNDDDDASRQSSVVSRSIASGHIRINKMGSPSSFQQRQGGDDDDARMEARQPENSEQQEVSTSSDVMDQLQVLLDNAGFIEINLDRCIHDDDGGADVSNTRDKKVNHNHNLREYSPPSSSANHDLRGVHPDVDEETSPSSSSFTTRLRTAPVPLLPSMSSVSTTTDATPEECTTPPSTTKRKTLRALLSPHKAVSVLKKEKNNSNTRKMKERRKLFRKRSGKKNKETKQGVSVSESANVPPSCSLPSACTTSSTSKSHKKNQEEEHLRTVSSSTSSNPEAEEKKNISGISPKPSSDSTPAAVVVTSPPPSSTSLSKKEAPLSLRVIDDDSPRSKPARKAAEVVQALAAVATALTPTHQRLQVPLAMNLSSDSMKCNCHSHRHHPSSEKDKGTVPKTTSARPDDDDSSPPPSPKRIVQQPSMAEGTQTSTRAVMRPPKTKPTASSKSDDDHTRRCYDMKLTPSEENYVAEYESRETVGCGLMQYGKAPNARQPNNKIKGIPAVFHRTFEGEDQETTHQEPDSVDMSRTSSVWGYRSVSSSTSQTTRAAAATTTSTSTALVAKSNDDGPSGWSLLQCGGLSFWGKGKKEDYIPQDDATNLTQGKQPQQMAQGTTTNNNNGDEQPQGSSPSSSKENLRPEKDASKAAATSDSAPILKEGESSQTPPNPKSASSADVNPADSASPSSACPFHDHPPLSSTLWPQAPLLLRPTPNSGTRIRGIRWDKDPSGDYLWDPSMEKSWTECLQDHWANQGQKSTSNTASDPSLGPLPSCCESCPILPINNGNEASGESLVVDFETELFVGSLMLRIRGSRGTTCNPSPEGKPEEDEHGNKGFFNNRALRFQAVIRGNFTKAVSWKEFLSGYQLERPCGKLPPKWVVWGGLKVLSFFAPQLSARFDGDRPYTFTPLGSTPRVVVVEDRATDYMGDLREEPTIKETSLVGKAFPIDNALHRARARKKAFDHWYTNSKSNPHFVDPDKTYTFEFLQHLFDYKTFMVDLGSIGHLDISDGLNGQAMQIMACHDKTRRPLWSFDIWNESLLKDAQKHYAPKSSPAKTTPTDSSSSTTRGVRARGKGGKRQ